MPIVRGEPVEDGEIVPSSNLVAELQSLAALHRSGALSDAEFSAAKARILGGSETLV